jgi:pyridoxamine 5'-phosphate oxidase
MSKTTISREDIESNPFVQFGKWYREHLSAGIDIPDSVSLGTAFSDGRVSVRTVLLKGYDETGFLFFTNYKSKKGRQIESNPQAALLFHWPESGRQIRIEGSVIKISEEESDKYFVTRPRESRLSAWASEQSSVIPDRQFLEDRFAYYKNGLSEKSIERPPHWGGYRLIPSWFEFWQSGEYRLHDRIAYSLSDDIWKISLLAP